MRRVIYVDRKVMPGKKGRAAKKRGMQLSSTPYLVTKDGVRYVDEISSSDFFNALKS